MITLVYTKEYDVDLIASFVDTDNIVLDLLLYIPPMITPEIGFS